MASSNKEKICRNNMRNFLDCEKSLVNTRKVCHDNEFYSFQVHSTQDFWSSCSELNSSPDLNCVWPAEFVFNFGI